MHEFPIYLLLHDGHLALFHPTADGMLASAAPTGDDWVRLNALEQTRALIEALDRALDAAPTPQERLACLIHDRAMQDHLAALMQAGLPLYAQRWRIRAWEDLVVGQGGVFDYPLPPLDAVRTLLQARGGEAAAPPMTEAPPSPGPAPAPESIAEPPMAPPMEPVVTESGQAASAAAPIAPATAPAQAPRTAPPPAGDAVPLDGEQLVHFLPALFLQPFTRLGGADLALLTGRVEPFDIPSPYPELSDAELDKRQRAFRALPTLQQGQMLAFARAVSARLRARPEMQAHFHTLEAD